VLSGVPTDLTIECDELGSLPTVDSVTATDNCDENIQHKELKLVIIQHLF